VADGRPCLLLSDPGTGEPRSADDLRALVEVLQTSPDERDLDTGRVLSRLSTPRSRSDPAATGKLPIIWRAVDNLAWTVFVFAVVPSLLVAGSALWPPAPGQNEGTTGQMLILTGMFLVLAWVIYLFAVVITLIGMAFMAILGGPPPERS
jgi:hypothetical protein